MPKPPRGEFNASAMAQARQAAGLSRVGLADLLDTDPDMVRLWESGTVSPTPKNLARIASTLGITTNDLYKPDTGAERGLDDLRVLAGFSQRQLARQLGINQAVVSQWERAKTRVRWQDITAYADVLGVPRAEVAAAIDVTAARHGPFPEIEPGQLPRPELFRVDDESPHVIYECLPVKNGGQVGADDFELTSPQFPRFAFRCKNSYATMLELATINEHLEADYLHRYNHIQWRCTGPDPENDPTYLIRWQNSAHDGHQDRIHKAADMFVSTPGWRAEHFPGPQKPMSTGEYLLVMVTETDTLGWIWRQLTMGEPAMLCPTFKYKDGASSQDGTYPYLDILRVEEGASLSNGYLGSSKDLGVNDNSTFLEFLQAVEKKHGNWENLVTERADKSDRANKPDASLNSYVPELFNKPIPYERTLATVSS
ncbi:helix-turn-helix domain-containing protein [Mycobacteroides abscessus]|uniref:helix-turn-helix domain-containing protein n=1 Tax=Mycobacteroides abscessus TaxID=36809 RepID=UPI000926014D|nr:helix-turn-helix transcriptional regulator [Mycobacteroides abscessus]SHT88679.1 putative transcriptional regulator [Mycobacteroides abscessus subsp. bolletii]SHX39143.1 putative transcriptional regulator [Mycobacteroides abscessus subsp. bolletii]SHX44608.1 putative transcriptional regulator [Mycobacteroides abscessus subsp. bolletii]SHX89724.1 putative transcriptional regulator [Mycobacteroides abscessus subsp. bolletii]SKS43423.1 putative transcriptional regulator [Mycobacteroides absces